jgi:hypothetical protein
MACWNGDTRSPHGAKLGSRLWTPTP